MDGNKYPSNSTSRADVVKTKLLESIQGPLLVDDVLWETSLTGEMCGWGDEMRPLRSEDRGKIQDSHD